MERYRLFDNEREVFLDVEFYDIREEKLIKEEIEHIMRNEEKPYKITIFKAIKG